MKLIIAGSRGLRPTASQITSALGHDGWIDEIEEVVSGNAVGVDREGELWAAGSNIPVKLFRPDYETYGRGAPLKRNAAMAQYADRLLVFWDGISPGTAHMIGAMQALGKPTRVVHGADGVYTLHAL